MSRSYVSKALRAKVAEQAKHRCGYCLTAAQNVGQKMDIEHIMPESKGGPTIEANLWLCCSECNSFKSIKTDAPDPNTGNIVALFNPRQQNWTEHFEWDESGSIIVGKTAVGRATVIALSLNRDELVTSRLRWAEVGWHPPDDVK